jgi:hypothetical protein
LAMVLAGILAIVLAGILAIESDSLGSFLIIFSTIDAVGLRLSYLNRSAIPHKRLVQLNVQI